jgi:hypothetical protein
MSDYNVKVFDPISCSYTYVSWYDVEEDEYNSSKIHPTCKRVLYAIVNS